VHLIIDKLKANPNSRIDGNRFIPHKKIPHLCVVQGDATYASIAAASILAKTHRDDYMIRLHKRYPQYGWNTNKAYATLCHRQAIKEFGLSPFHRKSFQCVSFPELEFGQ
jgi:ribonuclease HII